jgi:hypothetical protein
MNREVAKVALLYETAVREKKNSWFRSGEKKKRDRIESKDYATKL